MKKKSIADFEIAKEFLEQSAGKDSVDLVKVCQKKRGRVTDEEISKELKLKITEIRTILNRLHYKGIACYKKTKNPNTGWYSYTWEIKTKRIAELIMEQQAELIEKLEKKLQYEKNYVFFSCSTGCEQIPFEIASECQFRCPNCGKTMEIVDSKKRLNEIKKQIKYMGEQIRGIERSE